MATGPHLSIITLNVNGLNAPTKMDTKTRPLYMLSTRDPPQNKGYIQTENEVLEKKYFTQMETKIKQESQYLYQIK